MEAEGEGPLTVSLLCQEHALHIRVLDDGRLLLVCFLPLSLPLLFPLSALYRIGKTLLQPPDSADGCPQAHMDAHLVHHGEHAVQALALLSDQVPSGPVQGPVTRMKIGEKIIK